MSEEGEKSILDHVHVPVKDEAFPLLKPATEVPVTTQPVSQVKLSVVGYCPRCGAPIYGPLSVNFGELYATSHSCECRKLGTNYCSEGEIMAEKKTAKKKAATTPTPAKATTTKVVKKGKK